jgi:hypothetical protein
MRPARAAPCEPFVLMPLRHAPNERRNDLRGHLTRWKHLDLRANKGRAKSALMRRNVKRDEFKFAPGTLHVLPTMRRLCGDLCAGR